MKTAIAVTLAFFAGTASAQIVYYQYGAPVQYSAPAVYPQYYSAPAFHPAPQYVSQWPVAQWHQPAVNIQAWNNVRQIAVPVYHYARGGATMVVQRSLPGMLYFSNVQRAY